MSVCWDQTFAALVRSHLPRPAPDRDGVAPDADLALPAQGLDSVGMVALAASLEAAYGIAFPDEALSPATFRTMGTVWSVVAGLVAARQPAAAGDHRPSGGRP